MDATAPQPNHFLVLIMKSILRLTPSSAANSTGASQKLGIGEVILEKDFGVLTCANSSRCRHRRTPDLQRRNVPLEGLARDCRFSEDIDVSLSRECLDFPATAARTRNIGEAAAGGIADLAAACSRKIATEILPACAPRATSVLGDKGWFIIIDPDDSQTLHFTYPSDIGATTPDTYVRRK